jgi:N-acetylglucosaminyldiphosphoundecaprenol N-acetyl-beta-D-mannosaminyltransferase
MLNRIPSVPVGAVSVMAMSETEVTQHVSRSWLRGHGGSIVTVNVDILRSASRDPDLAALVDAAEIVVADGMPVVWAAAMSGMPVPERVAGSSLVWTLAKTAAREGRSVYLIGGDLGVPEAAARALVEQFPTLRVVGADSPPYGFERDERQLRALVAKVRRAAPDLVLVGLGFPKQERLITRLRQVVPRAWFLGCGAGIAMAAGQFRRAPVALQRFGAEWVHRLILEPRRLARRYLVNDLPFALRLLARARAGRFSACAVLPSAIPAPPVASLPRAAGDH